MGVDKKVGVYQMMMTAHHRPLTNEISYSLGKFCYFFILLFVDTSEKFYISMNSQMGKNFIHEVYVEAALTCTKGEKYKYVLHIFY